MILFPLLLSLLLVESIVEVTLDERCHDEPFCDLWTMDSRAICEGNIRFLEELGFHNVIGASRWHMYELQVWSYIARSGKAVEGYEDCDIFKLLCVLLAMLNACTCRLSAA
jgi:hypothetical protein